MEKDKKFDLKQLLEKAEQMKKDAGVDLSTEEDLSLAVMNLVSLEEHMFFTAVKTKKDEYLDLQTRIREMRKELLGRMISRDKHEGETWCITKHLLATTMRLMEVGSKLYADGKKDDAKQIYDRAHETYSMFWALRLKLIDPEGFKAAASEQKPWTYKDIVDKLVDCCDE